MAQSIPALNSTALKHCMLIDLEINDTTYRISNAYNPITYNGEIYTQLGHLLNMTEIQDELRPSNNQISLNLTGLPPDDGEPNYMSIALNSNLKGSRVRIYRAFFNNLGQYDPAAVYLRFSGYVNNFSLSDNWDQDSRTTANSIAIQCSSIHAIMEKTYTGRRTNENDQIKWFPGDRGMYRVKSLADTQFDFGKPYVATSSGSTYTPLSFNPGDGV